MGCHTFERGEIINIDYIQGSVIFREEDIITAKWVREVEQIDTLTTGGMRHVLKKKQLLDLPK